MRRRGLFKRDCPRIIDDYIDYFGAERPSRVCSWVDRVKKLRAVPDTAMVTRAGVHILARAGGARVHAWSAG